MSVQTSIPSQLPDTVSVEIFDEVHEADVVRTDPEASAGAGIQDVLVVDVDGSRYRVPAAEADPR